MFTKQIMRRSYQRGSFLLEALVALALIGLISYSGLGKVREYYATQVDKTVADYHNSVIILANRWVRDNYATAIAGATSTTPYVLSVTALNTAYGTSLATANRYAQTPCVLILQPSAGVLQPLFVTEGGTDLSLNQAQRIAQRMINGGTIQTVGAALTAVGMGQHYSVPMANYVTRNCSGTAATINRTAANVAYDTNTNRASFLYNTVITGNPNANTMFVDLNMNNHNINNVNTLNATTINATTINTTGNISAACFYDVNNILYFLCPSGQSNLNNVDMNNVRAAKYSGKTDPSYFVVPDTASNMNTVQANTFTGSIFYDKDNTTYYVDPASNSNIRNAFVTDRRSDVRLSNLLPNFVECGTSVPLSDGQTVSACTCLDGGQPSIYLVPKNIQIPANLIINASASLSGSTWTVSIKDGANAPVPNTTYFAKLGCYFS
jgi:hypothetical protein